MAPRMVIRLKPVRIVSMRWATLKALAGSRFALAWIPRFISSGSSTKSISVKTSQMNVIRCTHQNDTSIYLSHASSHASMKKPDSPVIRVTNLDWRLNPPSMAPNRAKLFRGSGIPRKAGISTVAMNATPPIHKTTPMTCKTRAITKKTSLSIMHLY